MIVGLLIAKLVLIGQVLAITISIPSRSKFCFYEDVQIANKGLEGAEHAKFSFTVIRGGKYKDVAASVISMHDRRFGSM